MNTPNKEIEIISEPNNFAFVEQWYELAGPSHFWMIWRLKAFLNQAYSLKLPLTQPLIGIEVGCGHGVFRTQIENNTNWSVDGAELDLSALKRNTKGRGRLFFYDILEQRQEFKNKYDFLFLYDVLEHIEHTAAFLDASCLMLKPGGLLFVNVPAIPALFCPYDTAAGHFRRYTKDSLADEFNTDKFTIKDIRYWGLSLIPVLLMRKLALSKKTEPSEIIRSGFKPPSHLINKAFGGLMSFETTVLKYPPMGTSVLAAISKT